MYNFMLLSINWDVRKLFLPLDSARGSITCLFQMLMVPVFFSLCLHQSVLGEGERQREGGWAEAARVLSVLFHKHLISFRDLELGLI